MNSKFYFLLLLVALIVTNVGCSSHNGSGNKYNSPPETKPLITQAPIQGGTNENISKNALRFVVVADSRGLDHGVNTKVVKKILGEIKKLSPQPEFAIMPGDLTDGSKSYEGIKTQLDYFKKVITNYYPIRFFYPGIGNHEMKAGTYGEKAFTETFTEFNATFLKGYNRTTYYFDVGDVRIFMLNSDHTGEIHKITGKQLEWLKANAKNNKRYNIFLLHEPPYPTGAEAGFSLDKYPAVRDAFWEVVNASKNPIVFCGHEHNYSRRLVDNNFNEIVGGKNFKFTKKIFQVISGGFGAPLYPQYRLKKNMVVAPIPQYHYTIVDVNESGISIQAVNIDGVTIDAFQVY